MKKICLFLLCALLALGGASGQARERGYYGWLRNCSWPKTLRIEFVINNRPLGTIVIVERATPKSIRFARPMKHEYTKSHLLGDHGVRILETGSFSIRSTRFKVTEEGVLVNGKQLSSRDEKAVNYPNGTDPHGTVVVYRDGAVCDGVIMTFPYADWQVDGAIPRCFAPHPKRVHSR
ncbi:MAG: hypothetical protein LBD68_04230 [Zoogloeaceae bacterium]|nr:hypothetical protein [Zoogloeaceae bacterium]